MRAGHKIVGQWQVVAIVMNGWPGRRSGARTVWTGRAKLGVAAGGAARQNLATRQSMHAATTTLLRSYFK